MRNTSRILAAFALATLCACAGSMRTIGMQDPTVETVRALAATQTAVVKALTDALQHATATQCVVPKGDK